LFRLITTLPLVCVRVCVCVCVRVCVRACVRDYSLLKSLSLLISLSPSHLTHLLSHTFLQHIHADITFQGTHITIPIKAISVLLLLPHQPFKHNPHCASSALPSPPGKGIQRRVCCSEGNCEGRSGMSCSEGLKEVKTGCEPMRKRRTRVKCW